MWHPVFTNTVVEITHTFCYFLVAYYFPFSACIHFEFRKESLKEIFSSKVQVMTMYFRKKNFHYFEYTCFTWVWGFSYYYSRGKHRWLASICYYLIWYLVTHYDLWHFWKWQISLPVLEQTFSWWQSKKITRLNKQENSIFSNLDPNI